MTEKGFNRMQKFKYEVHGDLTDGMQVALHDGSVITWKNLSVGALILSDQYLASACQELLGISIENLESLSRKHLIPTSCISAAQLSNTTLVAHSASNTLKFFEKDAIDTQKGNRVDDVAAYIEARSIFLVEKGDISIGRLKDWEVACDEHEVTPLNIGHREYYYLSHALIEMALNYQEGGASSILTWLIDYLKENPNTPVKLYALEHEIQIFLLWLANQARVPQLYVDCNGLDVANNWNKKTPLHPTVIKAKSLQIEEEGSDPYNALLLETELTKLRSDLGVQIPKIPGYIITKDDIGQASLEEQLLIAANLLKTRYGIDKGCLKPTDAGTGVRTVTHLDLDDISSLTGTFLSLHGIAHEDFILEAHVQYSESNIEGHVLPSSPSAHIRLNGVAEGISLQIMDGTCWEGNLYLDASTCEEFGISQSQYDQMHQIMEHFQQAFSVKAQEDTALGLVVAGVDFAIGKLGGKFGNALVLGVQDLNLRFHGAEFMRILQERVDRKNRHVVTLVIRPTSVGSLPNIKKRAREIGSELGDLCEALVAIPQRWGMIATSSDTPHNSIRSLNTLVSRLKCEGLIE